MKCNSLTVTNNSNSFNMTIKRNDDKRIKSLSPKQDSNHLKIKVNKSSLGTERIISKYSELKHSNKKLQNVRLVKTQVNENKDLEIDHLNEEIESYKVSNYELQCKIEAKLNERNDLELEQKEIAHYCNDLKAKFNNIEKTIQDYENAISNRKHENIQLQMVYDRRIDQINRENNQLTDKIEDRLEILTRQRDEIIQCEIEENKLVRQIEDDKNSFLERQMLNKIRYEELEKKFVNLQKRVVEIQLGEKIRKAEMRQVNLRPSTSYKNLNNDLDYKLQIAESDNNQLEQRLMELTNEWTVLLREHSPNRKCCTGKI